MNAKRAIEKLVFVFSTEAISTGSPHLLSRDRCHLGRLTHRLMGERTDWMACREQLGVPVEYVRSADLDPDLSAIVGDDVPCVLVVTEEETLMLLPPDAIERCGSVVELRGRLNYHAALQGFFIPLSRRVS